MQGNVPFIDEFLGSEEKCGFLSFFCAVFVASVFALILANQLKNANPATSADGEIMLV